MSLGGEMAGMLARKRSGGKVTVVEVVDRFTLLPTRLVARCRDHGDFAQYALDDEMSGRLPSAAWDCPLCAATFGLAPGVHTERARRVPAKSRREALR